MIKLTGSCDAHCHVFGPYGAFPPSSATTYVPPLAPFDRHQSMMADTGMDRAVLVQPTSYYLDHSALIDALSRAPGRLKGIGVIDGSTSDRELSDMRVAGIVGLRFVEMPNPNGNGRYPGTSGFDVARQTAGTLREHGFHVQLWAPLRTCVELAAEAKALGLTLVLDHMAGIGPETSLSDPDFLGLLDALDQGNVWIKLTYHRQSRLPHDYGDMKRAMLALVECNARRLLYASDWPFVRMEGREPDPRYLIKQLHDWVGQGPAKDILVNNPATLFGFPKEES
ncbi:MAG TPA: amidohydrolase family protein [Sphingobium sp.]|nr:amidohydrolase family protein [Sphingobium sp.]